MVTVQYTCIMNLNNTDFYVFSYSATGKKTEKGLREFSCYINLLYFFLPVCSRRIELAKELQRVI